MKQPTARLSVVTAALLLYALICAFPTGLWLFEIAAPFRLQVALAALVLAAINAFHRRKVSTTVSVLCALFLASHLPAFYADRSAPASQQPTLRLLHWNTWRQVHSSEDMTEVLNQFQPDVAFFQEVTVSEAAELTSNHYRMEYVGDFLVLVRAGIDITVPASAADWTDLPAVEISIRFDQQELNLYSIHPPAPFTPRRLRARNQFMAQLAVVVASGRNSSVVIGDFNTVPSEAAFQSLMEFADLDNSMIGFGMQTTWPFDQWWNPLLQIAIDHCLTCPRLQVVERQVADSKTSNHKPLIVDLQWTTDDVRRTQV